MDLNKLQIFKEVVIAGSFSKAANNLGQPKSQISRHITALERDLGVRLIYRTTRQFQLTSAGQELFQGSASLLNQLYTKIDQVRSGSDELSGTIRLSVPDDIGISLMGGICRDFMKQYPMIRLDLHVGNMLVDLVKDSFDLVVRIGKASNSTMLQRKLGTIGLNFYAKPSLIEALGPITGFTDLSRLPYLAFNTQKSRAAVVKLRTNQQEITLPLTPIFTSNNFFILRDLALDGVGFTALPPFLAKNYVSKAELIPLFENWQTEGGPIRILMPHQEEVPLRIKRFVDFLSDRLTEYLNT